MTGRAFAQPSFSEKDGELTLWYTEGDRKNATGVCDGGIGIYIYALRTEDGMSWLSNAEVSSTHQQ